jgi:hypothetical protein
MPIEVSSVRRRVQQRLEQVKQAARDRRVRVADAERDYVPFLENVATPVFRAVGSVLASENYPYKVFTPAGGVRLSSDRSGQTFVDLHLDSSRDIPQVMVEISRERGSHILSDERPVRDGATIASLTDEDVLSMLMDALGELIER